MASRGGGRGGGRAAYNPNDGYGGGGGGGQYYGGRGGGGGNADGGAGRGRGYVQGQGGGDGGGRGRGRGYQGGGDGGGRGRGYQGGGDGGGRGRGYQGGGDGGGRGRGRGYQQGGNDYGGGGRGYQQGGNDYGGGRGGGRGGGGRGGAGPSHPPAPAVLQPTGPPISDRYREEAAKLREKFKALDISRADPTFPARPGFGTGGQLCRVRANHFFVGLVDKGLHQYDVAISPEPTLKGVFRAVMSNLVREHQTTSLGGCLPAYDGRKSLYTAGELPFTSKEFDVILPDNRPGRERTFKVTIKHATLVSLQQLQMLMAGISTDIPAQALQVLDIVLRDIVLNERTDMGCVPVGRSFFSQNIDAPVELGLGIQGWTGFYQSMRPTQSGLSLNVDMSSTAFVQAGRLLDFIGKVLDWKDLRYLNQVDYLKIKKALRGLRVEVTHRGEVRRKYRITSLTNDPARDLRFQLSTGETKTVRDYFRETYNLQLKLDFLPCLNVGTDKKANYLPLEVCNIVPGQKYQKKLDDHQVSNMMKMACKGPTEREANILKSVRDNMYNTANRANEFGIEVDDNPTVVQARVLPAPMLKYHGSGSCNPQNGAWNMMGKKVVHGVDVGIWACVNFCHDLSGDEVVHFCEELKEVSTRTGVNFQRARRKIFHARPDQAEAKLREVQKEVRDMNMKIDFLLAILPDKNGNLYGDIKRICETDIGLMTQCCLRKNVERSNKQFLANVALKINAKCGGRNSVFANIPESLPVVSSKPTIIFGADVTHPKALDDFSPSIASVVASQDWPEVTKYHGDVHAQGRHEELIQGLEDIVKKLLRSFENQSKQRPRQLIFYRDGVSEGQFRQVLEKEIPEIEKAWQSLYNEKAPITFIVVQKRHHTRLFPTESKYQDKSGNILPGTVVDRQICHPTEFDFFLCSHAGIKGTSRPAHYHVLRDDNKFTADALQSLTNNLCYTYASCTRSVSTAPPAYYAHKLAFRARFYQSQDNDMATEVSFGSATKTDGSGSKPPPVPSLPEIKDELKRLMFYC